MLTRRFHDLPCRYVRAALGLPRTSELRDKWGEYLQRAEEGTTAAGIDAENGSVKSFLNRMLGLSVQLQNMIFSHFAAELDEQIKMAKSNDQFDEGVVDIRGERPSRSRPATPRCSRPTPPPAST